MNEKGAVEKNVANCRNTPRVSRVPQQHRAVPCHTHVHSCSLGVFARALLLESDHGVRVTLPAPFLTDNPRYIRAELTCAPPVPDHSAGFRARRKLEGSVVVRATRESLQLETVSNLHRTPPTSAR